MIKSINHNLASRAGCVEMKPPVFTQLFNCQVQLIVDPDLLEDRCLIRVGISVTFCLTKSPQSWSAKHHQLSANKMFTFMDVFLVSMNSVYFV